MQNRERLPEATSQNMGNQGKFFSEVEFGIRSLPLALLHPTNGNLFSLRLSPFQVLLGSDQWLELFSKSLNIWPAEVRLVVFAAPALFEFVKRVFGPHRILAGVGFVA